MDRDLSPDKVVSLRILLDRLQRTGERCSLALTQVHEGKMSREEYSRLLGEQIAIQREWEARHHRYHLTRD